MKRNAMIPWLLMSQFLLVPAVWGDEPTSDVQPSSAEVTPDSGALSDNGNAELKKQPATLEDIEGVRTEIETLREQWSRAYDNKTAKTTRPLQFSGIVQARYSLVDDKSASGGGSGGFDISAIILNLSGVLRRDYDQGKNVSYLFSLVAPSGPGDFTVKPLDAYINYSIFQSIILDQPFLNITLGQQKKPFGLEALATEDKKPTIKSAQSATKLGLDPRDIGIVLKGDILPHVDEGFGYRVPLVEYSLGLLNGNGPNSSDFGSKKDIAGRLVFNAPVDYNSPFRGLSVGGSYYYGKKSSVNTGTATAPKYEANTGDKLRWGVDVAYVNTPVGFTYEYIRAKDGTGAPATSSVTSEGSTFTLFYNFGEQFIRSYKAQDRYDDWYPLTYQPFFRYDRFDPNVDKAKDATDIYTIGFNWFFAETTKLQLNYNIKAEESKKNSSEFLAQFQFGF